MNALVRSSAARTAAHTGARGSWRRRPLALLVAVLTGSLLLAGCGSDFSVYSLPLPGGSDLGSDPITIKAQFADVLDLVPKSSVKVNDINVGEITKVELTQDGNGTGAKQYVATVTMKLRNDTHLPDNTVASIRQTSLLGEKFVSLAPPTTGSEGKLGNGDDIPIDHTGRNPEIEEVLGALSLVLNGGGVAQLHTIATELNKTLTGREDQTRDLLSQVRNLTGQLDDHRAEIINAISSINRLSISVRGQERSIDAALDQLPSALASLDGQRADLIKMLKALDQLSVVGVRVINRSKSATIGTLRQLDPVLTQLANSGSALVKSVSVGLTYPFVDQVVGRDPEVARNLRPGDYTNLSIDLDVDLNNLGGSLPGLPCTTLAQVDSSLPLSKILSLQNLCQGVSTTLQKCARNPSAATCAGVPLGIVNSVCKGLTKQLTSVLPVICNTASAGGTTGGTGGTGGTSGTTGGGLLGGLTGSNGSGTGAGTGNGTVGGLLSGVTSGLNNGQGLNRPPYVAAEPSRSYGAHGPTMAQLEGSFDPALVQLLTPGLVTK